MAGVRWPETQIDYLREHYSSKEMRDIASELNRSIKAIYKMAERLNLNRPSAKRKQAELVLRFCNLRIGKNFAKHSYGKEEESIFHQIKKLNQRGNGCKGRC